MRGSLGKIYQKKLVDKKRRRAFYYSLVGLLVLGVAFSGLSLLSQKESISIQEIRVAGASGSRAAAVESEVLENISGNFLAFFSKRNIFIYPTSDIREGVEAIPFVRSAEVKRVGLRGLDIEIKQRKEAATWCVGEIGDKTSCFSADENGFIFSRATTTGSFIYRGLLAGESEEAIGSQILPPEEFKETQFFVRELTALELYPREIVLDETNYMTVVLASGAKLIVNKAKDLSPVLSNIASIISDKTVVPSLPQFLQDLDYIKLDSGNKVVYKLK